MAYCLFQPEPNTLQDCMLRMCIHICTFKTYLCSLRKRTFYYTYCEMWQLKKYKRSVYDDSILHHKKQNNLTHYKSRDCSYAVIRNISANKACSVQTISRKRRAAALTQVPPFLRLRLRELTAVGSGAPS